MPEPDAVAPPQSPARLFWRQFRRNQPALAGAVLLAILYAISALAPFVAPYPEDEMDRTRFYHPPQGIHWGPPGPRVYRTTLLDPARQRYREDRGHPVPLRFLVRGARYRLLGVIPTDRHLVGGAGGERVNLLGT